MEEEIWRPVRGYEGLYEVSDMGRVRSAERILVIESKIQKLISTPVHPQCSLYRNGKQRKKSVRILMYEAFPEKNIDIKTRGNAGIFSQYPGVYWNNRRGLWEAKVGKEGDLRSLGFYKKESDAAAEWATVNAMWIDYGWYK